MPARPLKNESVAQLYRGIIQGDRSLLARAITLAESTRPSDRKKIEHVLERVLPLTGKSIRIGITGVPGVGKSTFIESFGDLLTQQGKKVAVLSVDPTSEKTKGSILGDKTRMERLSKNPNVFIRPSPSSLALGGVSHHTREAILLFEAAGFDIILIETVGVGQSETQVKSMVDFFLLLMLAGAGDELQGIKKGIIEMSDGIAITKADSDNVKAASQALADVKHTLHLHGASSSGWAPQALLVSAYTNAGIDRVWDMINEFVHKTTASGFFKRVREQQMKHWLDEGIEGHVREFIQAPLAKKIKQKYLKLVQKNKVLPSEAAHHVWQELISPRKKR